MFSLKGRTAPVTGSAGRLGTAIALRLNRHGADVVITGVPGLAPWPRRVTKWGIGVSFTASHAVPLRCTFGMEINCFPGLDISSNSTSATLEPTDKTVLGKKLSVLRLAAKDRLRYDIRFSRP